MEVKAVYQEKPKLGVEAKQRRALFATPYGQADVQLLPGKQAFSMHDRLITWEDERPKHRRPPFLLLSPSLCC